MAWQPPSAMAGVGGFAGDGAASGSHPQGTEYTLQGVMRFLQTEWHRHERDRNAWEIERAEMKSRIGRLEGDVRTSKRLHESVGKHVRLLEAALKKEREKVKKLSNGEKLEDFKDPKDIARESLGALKSQRPKINTDLIDAELDPESLLQSDLRQETERDRSRLYLSKCSQEVSYHVIPTSYPPPELIDHDLQNNIYGHQHVSQGLEYIPQQLQKQRNVPTGMMQDVDNQNHQSAVSQYAAENAGLYRINNQVAHPPASREASEMRSMEFQQPVVPSADNRKPTFDQNVYNDRDDLARYRVQAPSKENVRQQPPQKPAEESPGDIDGWNFDDLPSQEQPTEPIPRRRPDTDAFPNANFVRSRSPARGGSHSHRQKGPGPKRRSDGSVDQRDNALVGQKQDNIFKVRFALRGHLDVVRSVIFTGGGSPSEPEICTCSDDGTIKRWIIPASYGGFNPHGPNSANDLDITSYLTHRGHVGAVTALAACSPSQNFSNGGRALGDGWVFSGGQDASVKVWERGRVDPKATLDGHTDAVWGLCVLPGTTGSTFGGACGHYGGPDRMILVSGAADGKILIWSVSAPPQVSSPQAGSRTRGGSRRANSISSGSNFPSSPQPSVATSTPFNHMLVHHIVRPECPSPTCISPLSSTGTNFVVSYGDASIIVYDTKAGEEIVGMASLETYDGTPSTGVNSVVATTVGFDGAAHLEPAQRTMAEEEVHGATGSSGVEGVIISGYEDRYIRFFDANSGQCTYTMLAHPAAIASLSLSPDGHELVSAGHDASLRFWDLEKRSCTQEITSHRMMRGEGVCSAVWSRDGRWVISGGGDGVVKVFSR